MSKTTNKFSLEVRGRAVRLVLDNEGHMGRAGGQSCRFLQRSAVRPRL